MVKQKIAVLYGGPSGEHDVSVKSAKNVLENIDTSLYEPFEVFISRDGMFSVGKKYYSSHEAVRRLKKESDIVFPVLHGSFGEDGKLQKILEDEQVRFVGSGSKSSEIAMDKNASNQLFQKNGLNIPKTQIITKESFDTAINFPTIIKPVSAGSSIHLYKCHSESEHNEICSNIFDIYSEVMVQEYVKGQEFTCGVVEVNGGNIALPVTEIVLNESELFDYNLKYKPNSGKEITPANISLSLFYELQNIALKCHEVIGCRSISRTDMILTNENIVYVLETNTLPGMTKTSFIPAQAEAYGMSMRDLITHLIKSA